VALLLCYNTFAVMLIAVSYRRISSFLHKSTMAIRY